MSNEDEDKAAQRYPLWCVDAGSHRNEDRYRGPWPDKESALAGALDEWHEEDGDPKPTLRRCRRMLLSDVVGRAALGSYATHFVAEIDDDAAHEPENGMAWAHWEDSVLDTLEGFEDAMIAVLDRFVQTSVYVCEGDEQ